MKKKSFYESIDVFCLPSVFEAFGLVFLEAANYKIPSVATRVEGIPEVIVDGETGLLVDVKIIRCFQRSYISAIQMRFLLKILVMQRIKELLITLR